MFNLKIKLKILNQISIVKIYMFFLSILDHVFVHVVENVVVSKPWPLALEFGPVTVWA